MKILLVGGTFDNNGGHPSTLISTIHTRITETTNHNTILKNGGNVSELQTEIITSVKDYDVVMWFANVSNDEVKVRDVKAINPKTILITSKRNDDAKYTFAELITRSLSIKANLTIEFSKVEEKVFNMMVFDPLGNVYYNGKNIDAMTDALLARTQKLLTFSRVPSIRDTVTPTPMVPNETRFFNFAHECADIFHNLIRPAKAQDRFLGNMSFRCQNGFPSFRGEGDIVYVSRRNVDKSDIGAESFVPTYLDKDWNVKYFGEHKPSVDTPIQLRLYKLFPWANYMLHAHCYVDIQVTDTFRTCTTFNPVPCGAIEEVEEIMKASYFATSKNAPELLAVNLVGHGCILIAQNVDALEKLKKYRDNCFVRRPMPEMPLSMFKKHVFTEYIGDQNSFEEYFAEKAQTPNELSDMLMFSSDYGIVIEEFCEKGSMHPVRNKIFTTGARNDGPANPVLEDIYEKVYETMPERIFTHLDDKLLHIAVISRDVTGVDYYIFVEFDKNEK